eukprot:5159006-Pyramimonas_sp.AAC.1
MQSFFRRYRTTVSASIFVARVVAKVGRLGQYRPQQRKAPILSEEDSSRTNAQNILTHCRTPAREDNWPCPACRGTS